MLQVISPLKGFIVEASDGGIGSVVDFLFDDESWRVRWLVVDCGRWLVGRKVLIHPQAVSHADFEKQLFVVGLTREQVDASPAWEGHQPVSEQMQSRLYDHYDWDPVWGGAYFGGLPGAMASPMMGARYAGFETQPERSVDLIEPEGDPHLRSIVEVIGYHIHALDGGIGHVQDLLFDMEDWSLHYFIVDTSNWWFGRHVLIAPYAVTAIDWSLRQVQLDVDREKVKASPSWDPLVAFDEIYKKTLHRHYGWPGSLG